MWINALTGVLIEEFDLEFIIVAGKASRIAPKCKCRGINCFDGRTRLAPIIHPGEFRLRPRIT